MVRREGAWPPVFVEGLVWRISTVLEEASGSRQPLPGPLDGPSLLNPKLGEKESLSSSFERRNGLGSVVSLAKKLSPLLCGVVGGRGLPRVKEGSAEKLGAGSLSRALTTVGTEVVSQRKPL